MLSRGRRGSSFFFAHPPGSFLQSAFVLSLRQAPNDLKPDTFNSCLIRRACDSRPLTPWPQLMRVTLLLRNIQHSRWSLSRCSTFGCEGSTQTGAGNCLDLQENTIDAALALGVAFQMTNILRDVGEAQSACSHEKRSEPPQGLNNASWNECSANIVGFSLNHTST
eukprot:5930521-Amphidinium_carterae.2